MEQVALARKLAKKPFIVPIPGTIKLVHLQENLWAVDFVFTSEELTLLIADLNKINIAGERYTGLSAQQTGK